VRSFVFHGTDFEDLNLKEKQGKRMYFKPKGRIFPFGDVHRNIHYDKATRCSSLPSASVVETLVDRYLVTVDKLFPLLDPIGIKDELQDFWRDPGSVSDEWLAQLYLILSLSCYSHPGSSLEDVDMGSATEKFEGENFMGETFMDAAESCYSTRSFMKRTKYTDIRVLCMIAIAKIIHLIPEADVAWNFVGLIARIAMGMQLHRDPTSFPNMPPRDAEARKRIWTTVQMLDLLTSIDVGHQMICLPENSDTPAPANNIFTSEDGTVDTLDPDNDTAFQLRLMVVFPTVCSIVNKVNGLYPQMPYREVLKYDEKIRDALRQTHLSSGAIPRSRLDPSLPDWVYLQKTTVNNLLRRVLLALHQSHARDAKESSVYQKSHWTILECSLAILRNQTELFENPRLAWATEFFRSDFRAAIIHLLLALRNKHFSDKPEPGTTRSAKDLAWETLKAGFEMMKCRVYHSVDHYKGFIGLAVGIGALEALEKGTPVPEAIRNAAEKAFADAEEQILKHRPQIDPSLSGLSLDPDVDSWDSGMGSGTLSPPFLWNDLDPTLFDPTVFDGSFDFNAFVGGDVYWYCLD
jgi:hypothetical protein